MGQLYAKNIVQAYQAAIAKMKSPVVSKHRKVIMKKGSTKKQLNQAIAQVRVLGCSIGGFGCLSNDDKAIRCFDISAPSNVNLLVIANMAGVKEMILV